MLRMAGVLAGALGLGAVLAWAGMASLMPVGWIGALGLVGWAGLARRQWRRRADHGGNEPGAPERIAWQRLVGASAVLGHLTVCLLNPRFDLHVGQGNFLAIDVWTLILGVMAAAFLFRDDPRERDERDEAITAIGRRAGYTALIVMLIALLEWLGFAPKPYQAALTHWVLANLLVAMILAAFVAQRLAQLLAYAPDRGGEGAP